VVTAGKDSDLIRLYLSDEPVLLIDSPGPAPGEFVFEWIRLAEASEGFTLNFADKADDAKGLGRSFSIHHAKSSRATVSN